MQPTISPEPTVSLSPTQGPQCEGSNPKVCGCGSVNQADYRGSINTTVSGKECIRWDDLWVEEYPDAGLEDNNYCRHPNGWVEGAFCITADGSEDCDVPYCFPPASSCPSLLVGNTNTSGMSEDLQQACAYHQCVVDSDYVLVDYIAPKRAKVKPDCTCAFEVWDCKFGTKECELDPVRQNANECCVSKLSDLPTPEASCDCSIKLDCEDGDSAKCHYFAEFCCDKNDQQCKCDYKTKACRLALESDVEEVSTMASSYCGSEYFGGSAQSACCGEDNYDKGLCNCDFWEPLCTHYPNAQYDTCYESSKSCCSQAKYQCRCDFATYAVEALGYEDENGDVEFHCDLVEALVVDLDRALELQSLSLQSIYNETEGEYWLNNTGWTTEQDQCSWFGISCDGEDYVIEINLPSNNMTGEFPTNSLSSFDKLTRLVLGNNSLHGTMAGTSSTWGGDSIFDASLFLDLRDLTHVDLSQNNLSGEVDVLFAPALQYANFSHNNFTSTNSFKKFKRSHQTLTVCDVSHNFINTSASDLMTNVPTNIEQFILSSNLIHGPLPTTLEELANLRQIDMSMNSLSGEIPDFSNSYPNLQVFDLSDQIGEGLVGNIPESLANLPFLSTLNFGGNQLAGSIPPALGNMGQLRVLNLSSNKLSEVIPKELGKLGEFIIICVFYRVMMLILSISPVSYGHTPLADLELFDLSDNELTGQIPSELDRLQTASIHLSGNLDM